MPIRTILRNFLSLLAGLVLCFNLGAQALPGYVLDSSKVIVRSGTGLCWHSGSWTAADAILGCDGPLAPPVANITAPPLVVTAPPPIQPAPPLAVQRCDLHLSLSGENGFRFDETRLQPAAALSLDRQLLAPLADCTIERIVIRGHTDRLGSASYNASLSQRRADAVAAYLADKGLRAPTDAQGAGASAPVSACSDRMAHRALVDCLAPDRRVTVEVFAVRRP